jgi:hypothetical protein
VLARGLAGADLEQRRGQMLGADEDAAQDVEVPPPEDVAGAEHVQPARGGARSSRTRSTSWLGQPVVTAPKRASPKSIRTCALSSARTSTRSPSTMRSGIATPVIAVTALGRRAGRRSRRRSHARASRATSATAGCGGAEEIAGRHGRGGEQVLAVAQVRRHRLLDEDVLARLERRPREARVLGHARQHEHGVDVGVLADGDVGVPLGRQVEPARGGLALGGTLVVERP